jgi:hypothetical protein
VSRLQKNRVAEERAQLIERTATMERQRAATDNNAVVLSV